MSVPDGKLHFMSDEAVNWHTFLCRWQEEWAPRADHEEEDGEENVGSPRRGGASEAEIAAAEKHLGPRLPPSYRQFLAVSDGWHVDQTAGVYQLGGVADIDWSGDPYDLTALYTENLDDDPRAEDVQLAGMWERSLPLETDSDMTLALLDPGDRDEDGEWALYIYKGWSGEFPDRYPSFRAYMEAMYRSFHADRVERSGFDNATTRAQDTRARTPASLLCAAATRTPSPCLRRPPPSADRTASRCCARSSICRLRAALRTTAFWWPILATFPSFFPCRPFNRRPAHGGWAGTTTGWA